MALSINLRGDLAKLSDAELAGRLKEAWTRYDAVEQPRKVWWARWTLLGARGPVKHPRAYRFLAALQAGQPSDWLGALFIAIASQTKSTELLSKVDHQAAMHLHICEIHDILDEIERRIDQRKGGGAT